MSPGDLVELTGGEGSGKTEMLLNIVAQCVLPRTWQEREIGGREVEVVWVSTDYKFDVLRLMAILEGQLCHDRKRDGRNLAGSRTFPNPDNYGITPLHGSRLPLETITCRDPKEENKNGHEGLIMSCLSRLHVIHCTSSNELLLTLHSLRLSFLPNHPEVCALVLDNVAEFHWIDRAETGSLHRALVKQEAWVKALDSVKEEHHLVVFSGKPLLFASQTTSSGACKMR